MLKKSLKQNSQLTIQHQLSNLLLSYQSTPHTATGVSSAELFLKQQLRVHLSMVKPDQEGAVLHKQEKQKEQHDHGTKILRSFTYARGDRCCETVSGSTQVATRRCCSVSWADKLHGASGQ